MIPPGVLTTLMFGKLVDDEPLRVLIGDVGEKGTLLGEKGQRSSATRDLGHGQIISFIRTDPIALHVGGNVPRGRSGDPTCRESMELDHGPEGQYSQIDY